MSDQMPATPFEAFVAPARAYPQVWRLVVGVVVICVTHIITAGAVIIWLDHVGVEQMINGRTPSGLIMLLAFFSTAILATGVVVGWLHKRTFTSLLGPYTDLIRDFQIGAAVFGITQLGAMMIWFLAYDAVPNVGFGTLLFWLPLLIIGLLIQTGAEEILFRGYIMQQLAARFANPVIWLFVPQILFALVHYDPEGYGDLLWPVIGLIFVWALMWADLTRITGNIGAAWGWHFANNALLMIVIAPQGALDGLSLWVTPYSMPQTPAILLIPDVAVAIISWLVLRQILRPKV